MNTSEEKLRQLMQDRLGNLETPVNPALWNGIQSGLQAVSGSAASTTGLFKATWLKIAGLASGVIAAGVITAVVLNSEADTTPDPEAASSPSQVQQDFSAEQPAIEAPQETKPGLSTLYTAPNAVEVIEDTGTHEAENVGDSRTDEFRDPMKVADGNVSRPTDRQDREQPQPDPTTNYAQEVISAGFIPVSSPGMGLEYLFIPEYTRAHGYRWYVNEQLISTSMSPSYEFEHPGEYIIHLEVLNENGEVITELSRNTCISGSPAWKIDANYFTPNGDGFSDAFEPYSQAENIIVTGLFIYNDRNQLIFSRTDQPFIWYGNDEYGNPFPDGHYMYRITGVDACDGKVDDKTGTMALRR